MIPTQHDAQMKKGKRSLAKLDKAIREIEKTLGGK